MNYEAEVKKVYPDAVCDTSTYKSYKIWKSKDYWAKLIGVGETEELAWEQIYKDIQNLKNDKI